jgi:hypothetical protein
LELILGVGDGRAHPPARVELFVQVELGDEPADERLLVVVVVDGKGALVAQLSMSRRRMRAQQAWKVITQASETVSPASAITRARISRAALLVKVMARIDQAGTPFRSGGRCGG